MHTRIVYLRTKKIIIKKKFPPLHKHRTVCAFCNSFCMSEVNLKKLPLWGSPAPIILFLFLHILFPSLCYPYIYIYMKDLISRSTFMIESQFKCTYSHAHMIIKRIHIENCKIHAGSLLLCLTSL